MSDETGKTLDTKMEKLANKIADLLLEDLPVSKGRTDALKALNVYFIATRKLSAKIGDDDNNGDNFGEFKRSITSTPDKRN